MKLSIFTTIYLLLVLCAAPTAAQQSVVDLETLNILYQEFRYKEVIRQGEKLLSQNTNIPKKIKCDIHRLLALSYYSEQDMQGALKNFSAIVKIDWNYRLDPRENYQKSSLFLKKYEINFRTWKKMINQLKAIAS